MVDRNLFNNSLSPATLGLSHITAAPRAAAYSRRAALCALGFSPIKDDDQVVASIYHIVTDKLPVAAKFPPQIKQGRKIIWIRS